MPVKLLPIQPVDPAAAEAIPHQQQIEAANLLATITRPEAWTMYILQALTNGAISMPGAIFLQRYILTELGHRALSPIWAALVTVESIGRVDAHTLSLTCLAGLMQHAQQLHFQVTTGNIKTATRLRDSIEARKVALKSKCDVLSLEFLPFLDRVGDALTPYLKS